MQIEESKEKAELENEIVKNEFNDNFVQIKGVLAWKNFDYLLFDEEEIPKFTQFTKVNLFQKLVLQFEYEFDYLINAIETLYKSVWINDTKV